MLTQRGWGYAIFTRNITKRSHIEISHYYDMKNGRYHENEVS